MITSNKFNIIVYETRDFYVQMISEAKLYNQFYKEFVHKERTPLGRRDQPRDNKGRGGLKKKVATLLL